MTESRTPLATTTNATPGGGEGIITRDTSPTESLRGWTIEAKFNSKVCHASHSRSSSFESSSALLDEEDAGRNDNENDDGGDDYDEEDDDELNQYNLEVAVRAWDQIAALTQEITSSLMAKQASVLCDRFRRKSWPSLKLEPATKKRRIMDKAVSSLSAADERHDALSSSAVVVVSDEDTASHDMSPTDAEEEGVGLPDDLSSQVDRIGRMSKLVMEIEYCQQALRREMVAMRNQV